MAQAEYVYCPYCSTELVGRRIHGRVRRACPACGFTHFREPKVAVVGEVSDGERLLLVRRGVEPKKGLWALPGGYMDAGELPKEALQREILEETGLQPEVGGLLALFPMADGGEPVGVVLAYSARIQPSSEPVAGDDVLEARWFAPDEIPAELAFESTRKLLARRASGTAHAPASES